MDKLLERNNNLERIILKQRQRIAVLELKNRILEKENEDIIIWYGETNEQLETEIMKLDPGWISRTK